MVGLTGTVAAGKSTVASVWREAGCRVLDVDRMGHDALSDASARDAVRAAVGDTAFRSDGSIDRAVVAAEVFRRPEALRRIESVVHPIVRRRLEDALAGALRERPRAVVVDCALLFEGGLDPLCDTTVSVDAPRAVRAARASAGRGWSDDELRRRESLQLDASEKRARAAHRIENDSDPDTLRRRALRVLDDIAPPADARGARPQEGHRT